MKELTCIVCPKGCRLNVDEENDYAVTGNSCEKGAAYGYNELTNPMRMVTSTVKIQGGNHRRLPVKTSGDIPRKYVMDCVKLLDDVTVQAPVKTGDVILADIFGLGVNIIAAKDM